MNTLDEKGKACPIPVIETRKALDQAPAGTRLEVVVDNATAVRNLAKFAAQQTWGFEYGEQNPGNFHVVLTKTAPNDTGTNPAAKTLPAGFPQPSRTRRVVVAVSSASMGEGDERLGATLLKGFLYALTEQDTRPSTMVFYNGGAHLTVEDSESLPDLQKLESEGVEILTCGTCLNHYGIVDRLAVGAVTNMYTIAELLLSADSVVRP